MGEALRSAGIAVHNFQRGHRFDFQHWLSLRRLLRDAQPDLIHVWGLDALRTLQYASFLRRSSLPPLVLSLPPTSLRYKRLSWWERRLLSRAARFIATCESDCAAFASLGFPAEKTRLLRPGVPIPSRPRLSVEQLNLPKGPILMACGHMHGFGRMMDAIWVAEILSYVVPNLQTVVIGEGGFRHRILDYFLSMPRIAESVHFLGARADAPELLALADVVIVPHRRLGGTFTTLEAMAAGRPVVATRLPHLGALLRDDETGMLANMADQPGLARGCLRLLESESKRDAIGAAAKESVLRDFSLDAMVAAFAETYDEALRH